MRYKVQVQRSVFWDLLIEADSGVEACKKALIEFRSDPNREPDNDGIGSEDACILETINETPSCYNCAGKYCCEKFGEDNVDSPCSEFELKEEDRIIN